MKKPTDAGQPGAQVDGTNPPDSSGPADPPNRKTADSRADLQQRLHGLKPGHPSSPYNGDGSLKPAPVDISELESASDADGHDSNPAGQDADHARQDAGHADPAQRAEDADHADDRASEGWRAALPQLQARWERHEERWPAEQRPPVDRSKDAPGSWRGDTGDYLSYEENLVTEQTLDRVRKAEPEVTRMMKAIEAEVPGARLEGLEYCLKGEDRYKEKIAARIAVKSDRSVEKEAAAMPDALRYTLQFSTESYVDGCLEACRQLREHGCQPVLIRNSWENSQYKGINSQWRTAEGQKFEVQFHTAESFEAKQLTHGAYERLRNTLTDKREMGELRAFQRQVAERIPVPDRLVASSTSARRMARTHAADYYLLRLDR